MDPKKLQKMKARLYSRTTLIGGWVRRRAAEELARDGSPKAVGMLAEAVTRSDDEHVRTIALKGLQQLADQGCIEAQEALCHLVIDHDHPQAREIVLAAHYAPSDPHQRALFYFLTGQWDKYEGLDFDQSLLGAVYEVAGEGLRRRIAKQARQAGRVEWVPVVAGGRRARRLGEMMDEEWQAALEVLGGNRRWEEIWRLAQAAPAVWSVQLLRQLGEAGWFPRQAEEQAGFAGLLRLTDGCAGQLSELGMLACSRATLRGHRDTVSCLAMSPDGLLLASGSDDGTVRLWRLPDGAALKMLEGHADEIWCLAISRDGRVLASGGYDGAVRLWALPDGEVLRTLEGHRDVVKCLAITPDGQLLASGSQTRVWLWRLPDGGKPKILQEHTDHVNCMAISPDGRLLATGSLDHTVRLWRLPDGALLKTLRGHTSPINCLVISPDGQLLASAGGYKDKTVRLWRLPDGTELKTVRPGWVWCLLISPDGQLLASGSGDGRVRLWRLPDGTKLKTLRGHRDAVHCLATSPDGRMLASGSGRKDGTVRLWRLPEGKALKTLTGGRDAVGCLAISPDGRVLASGSDDGAVRLWTSLLRVPVGQTSLEDMEWPQQALRDGAMSDAERGWLEFMVALMRWRRRFDIEVEEAPRRIAVGEFDIEIEG